MFIMGWPSLLCCLWVFIFRSTFCEAHLPPDLLREYLPRLIDVGMPHLFLFLRDGFVRLCQDCMRMCSFFALVIFLYLVTVILYFGTCAGVFFQVYTVLWAWHTKDSLKQLMNLV
jgi:hypothetical protein